MESAFDRTGQFFIIFHKSARDLPESPPVEVPIRLGLRRVEQEILDSTASLPKHTHMSKTLADSSMFYSSCGPNG